jgi:uncharacterized membrane protein
MYKKIGKRVLNENIYRIIVFGLIAAIVLMITGFFLNIVFNDDFVNLEDLEKNILKPEAFHSLFTTSAESKLPILYYAGIFLLMIIPIVILFYSLIYFIKKKDYKIVSVIISVILILILSVIIGFIK